MSPYACVCASAALRPEWTSCWLNPLTWVRNAGSKAVVWYDSTDWWNWARRASNVVTMDVPTLLPILRMKFTRPETLLLFSAGIPI